MPDHHPQHQHHHRPPPRRRRIATASRPFDPKRDTAALSAPLPPSALTVLLNHIPELTATEHLWTRYPSMQAFGAAHSPLFHTSIEPNTSFRSVVNS
ncbi:hypothetical protein Q1695_002751 [Nippostrongylus brasiliensis]|nr:hypothetical protein Q1695_002751 [Nippostrongylus brasiliensis]